MGAAGAALATTIAEFLVLIIQVILGYKDIQPSFHEIHFLRYPLFTAISLFVTIAISFIPITNTFLRLIIATIFFFGTYVICLYSVKDYLFMKALDNKFMTRLNRNFKRID